MIDVIRFINRRRHVVFLLSMCTIALVGVAIVVLLGQKLNATPYIYVALAVTFVLYALLPLYVNRRLATYYLRRTSRNRLAILGLAFILFLVVTALVGPFFTLDPTTVNFEEKNLPPIGFSVEQSAYNATTGKMITVIIAGVPKHPIGTDNKGRDMLAMLVSGARVSLQVGLLATVIALTLGTVLGVTSAYMGRWVDNVLMRFTDIMMTFPFFLLLVFIVFIFGPNLTIIVLVIGLTGWTGAARLIRSEALSLRTREFILASKALGASSSRLIFGHFVPNVISLVIVMATLSIPGVILAEAALSFIGLGDPTIPSWGSVLKAGQQSLDSTWWVAVEPGIVLFLTVLAFNFLGDGMRDAFDPKSTS